jgi:beta-glucosidase
MPGLFRDPAQPLAARVDDLLGKLTLDEKVALLHQHAPGVPRLGLADFRTGKEALHGAAWDGRATVFPQAVGLGATWDPALLAEVGEAVGREVRAQRAATGLVSLVVWAPVVNLLRDPRWGRNEEGYSEDPLLTARLATAMCRGLAGDRAPYLRTVPVLKHFVAYNREQDRSRTSVSLRPRVFHEYELPVFVTPLAEGAAAGVMPSYNLVNGRPAHLLPEINEVLRRAADGELLVCSDAGAPSNIVDEQGYAPDHPTAHAWALHAGVDSFTDRGPDPSFTVANLKEALERGLAGEPDIDRAARRVLLARLRSGELDPDGGPFERDGEGRLCSAEHAWLARRAAEKSVVLLRNQGELLPLSLGPCMRVAVVGPLASSVFADWYSGTMVSPVTVAGGLREMADAAGATTAVSAGVDRVVLRAASDHMLVGEYDVFEWGGGVVTLRDVRNGLYLTAREDGTLVADQVAPNGWVCRETFVREAGEGGTVLLRNRASGLYLCRAAGAAALVAGSDPDRGEQLRWEVVVDGAHEAAALAKGAEVVVVVVGNHPLVNGRETEDRLGIALPEAVERLVVAVSEQCGHVVLVIMSSYPYSLGPVAEIPAAICWVSHAGQEAGRALASVLTGESEPGGRLAQTWYRSDADLPDMTEYDIIKARRTYLYFGGTPLYPFGHGLTYTRFDYGPLEVSVRGPRDGEPRDGEPRDGEPRDGEPRDGEPRDGEPRDGEPRDGEIRDGDVVVLRLDVTNSGRRAGTEVVQFYAGPPAGAADRPRRRLCGFARVALAPGESSTVEVPVPSERLAYWDVRSHRMALDDGEHELMAGASSADIRCSAKAVVKAVPPGPRLLWGEGLAAADFDDYCGVELVDAGPEGGTAISPRGQCLAWALFRYVDLGAGDVGLGTPLRLRLRLARAGPGAARLELRTGDPVDGAVLACMDVPSTGGPYCWQEVEAEIQAAGARDLYIVFTGDQRLASVRLEAPR